VVCRTARPRLHPRSDGKTARRIANNLLEIVGRIVDPTIRTVCEPPAIDFKKLVGTAPDGAQRLFRDGMPWISEVIDDAADAFAECCSRLNALLYKELRDGLTHTLHP